MVFTADTAEEKGFCREAKFSLPSGEKKWNLNSLSSAEQTVSWSLSSSEFNCELALPIAYFRAIRELSVYSAYCCFKNEWHACMYVLLSPIVKWILVLLLSKSHVSCVGVCISSGVPKLSGCSSCRPHQTEWVWMLMWLWPEPGRLSVCSLRAGSPVSRLRGVGFSTGRQPRSNIRGLNSKTFLLGFLLYQQE